VVNRRCVSGSFCSIGHPVSRTQIVRNLLVGVNLVLCGIQYKVCPLVFGTTVVCLRSCIKVLFPNLDVKGKHGVDFLLSSVGTPWMTLWLVLRVLVAQPNCNHVFVSHKGGPRSVQDTPIGWD
jgi:hypothetical protein